MERKTWKEAVEIRDMVRGRANGLSTDEQDAKLYRMFGSCNQDMFKGIVIGMDLMLGITSIQEDVEEYESSFLISGNERRQEP